MEHPVEASATRKRAQPLADRRVSTIIYPLVEQIPQRARVCYGKGH